MQIDLVIFDLNGTLIEDRLVVSRCLLETLGEAGVEVNAEAIREVMGLAKTEAIQRLIEQSDQREEMSARAGEIHAEFVARMLRHYQNDSDVMEISGASEVLSRLSKRNVRIALSTSFPRVVMQAMLDRMGWMRQGLISATVASDEVRRGRPHPDLIQYLMKRLFVRDARRLAKVGDTPADLLEGANAGCEMVIGVTTGAHLRNHLVQFPHSHIIDSVAELPGLLGI
jgi:phosphonatase-like hydrolase